jgi:uncharacterized membrane protein HdeD (DUF308 family)
VSSLPEPVSSFYMVALSRESRVCVIRAGTSVEHSGLGHRCLAPSPAERKRIPVFRSSSTSFVWRGLLALAVGIVAIVWPGVTILAVVIIFAIASFGAAIIQASRAFSGDGVGSVIGHVLIGLIDVTAGVVALSWPGITAYVLTIWIGAWAVVSGVGEFAMTFASSETAGQRALFGLGGFLSVAFGIVLFARPDLGAVSLAEILGLFSLAYGISSLVLSTTIRDTGLALSRGA